MKKTISFAIILVLLFTSITPIFTETDDQSGWAEESIVQMKGFGQFRDDAFNNYKGEMTRLEFIYIAVRVYELLDGKEIVIDSDIKFNDTDDEYALKGATIGLTSGVGSGNFGTGGLNREQLATFMVRILTLLELDLNEASTEEFEDDADISSWAKNAIYLAKNNNIISGVGNNKVNPSGVASTEMAIVIANRILVNNGYTVDTGDKSDVALTDSEESQVVLNKEYWTRFADNDDAIEVLESLPEGTKTYNNGSIIMVGSDNYLNTGDLRVSTHENFDDVKFQITGWSQVGVQDALKQFLNLYTLDGDEIFAEIVKGFDGIDIDSLNAWDVGANGTEFYSDTEGRGITIIVKK